MGRLGVIKGSFRPTDVPGMDGWVQMFLPLKFRPTLRTGSHTGGAGTFPLPMVRRRVVSGCPTFGDCISQVFFTLMKSLAQAACEGKEDDLNQFGGTEAMTSGPIGLSPGKGSR